MRFRDLLGGVNQRVGAACDTVVLMVAGVPLTVKTPSATRER
jgi:adenosyl cobinamide kinase/adenosyl cobinamide phosphate guanylyltransferase